METPKKEAPGGGQGRSRSKAFYVEGNSTRAGNTPLERAKELIRISEAWQRLGLPGKPGKSCKSPLREDRSASFSVFDDDRHFKDHASGDKGDVVDFIAKALGITLGEAAQRLIQWAGTGNGEAGAFCIKPMPPRPVKPTKPEPLPRLPELHKPTYSEVLAIQMQRRLPMTGGIEVAINRGLLWTAEVYDNGQHHPAWVMTDSKRVNAQARRLDGKPWESRNIKAKTLPGMKAAWPIGAADLGDAQNIILTEGPPDLLAAITLAWIIRGGIREMMDLGFVCVAGAANLLHPDSLPMFKDRHVRIVYDQDEAGWLAAGNWATQLANAGAIADGFNLAGLTASDGKAVKDLNDACHIVTDDEDNPAQLPEGLSELVAFNPHSTAEVAS